MRGNAGFMTIFCYQYPSVNKPEIRKDHLSYKMAIFSEALNSKGEELPMCIRCDELLTIEHTLLTCSGLIEIRESHFTAQSLCVLFQEISPEKIFNFLKEINICGKFLT